MLLLHIAQAVAVVPEPPPAGWAAAPEALLRHAEARPDVFWPVAATVLPLLIVGAFLVLVVRWVLPAWREEKEADRKALAEALKLQSEETKRDAEKDREVARAQNDAVVSRIEGKLDSTREDLRRSSDRIDRISEQLARVAAKVAVAVFVVITLSGATCR